MTAVLAPSPARRTDASLIGRLNTEWDQLRTADSNSATVTSWATHHDALDLTPDRPGIHHTTTGPADLELLNLLAWAVDTHTITPADATLIIDIYAPAPGHTGGQTAAHNHGLTWPTARQRASRAIRRITPHHPHPRGVVVALNRARGRSSVPAVDVPPYPSQERLCAPKGL